MSETLLPYLTVVLTFALAPAAIVFACTWWIARRINNWSLVDVVWSYSFALLAGIALPFAVGVGGGLQSYYVHGALVIAWSLRLGTHLAIRWVAHLGQEDGRYLEMTKRWGDETPRKMAIFYAQQAVATTVLMLPFLASAQDPMPMNTAHWIGAAIVVLALIGESIADNQLAAFKRDAGNRGKVCEVGLWSWTRHPNYFCEWLVWVGFALLSWTPHLYAIPGVICAAAMYHLLTKVTGVAISEEQLARSKGAAYADYQRRVPAFWPRPPRS